MDFINRDFDQFHWSFSKFIKTKKVNMADHFLFALSALWSPPRGGRTLMYIMIVTCKNHG